MWTIACQLGSARELFDLYLQHRSLIDVCRVVNDRGWTTKTSVYKNGRRKEGVPWNKARLYDILVNVTYIGKVAHKGELYSGEQVGIVDERIFDQAQRILKHNSQNGGAGVKNKHGALIKGLLRCGHCGAAMTHTYSKKGNRLYRYYMCLTRMKRGADACPTPSLPAQEIEDFVVEQIRKVARDPELVHQVFTEATRQHRKLAPKLEKERKRLVKDRQAKGEDIRRLVDTVGTNGESTALGGRLAALEGVVAKIDRRVAGLDAEMKALRENAIDLDDVARKLAEFEGLWEVLGAQEQTALIQVMIAGASVGADARIAVQFHSRSFTANL